MKHFFDGKRSLVLGGGAARGFIHLGVYKRLEEHTYMPTEIVGNSMGSIIGAAIAMGMSFQQIYDIAEHMHWKNIADLHTRSKGLFTGKKVVHMLKEVFGTISFSALSYPLTVTAANISTMSKIVYKEGVLVDALRSSISIPGVFAPVRDGDTIIVDGGIVSNLPVEETMTQHILGVSTLGYPHLYSEHLSKRGGVGRLLHRSLVTALKTNEDMSCRYMVSQDKQLYLIRPLFPHKLHHFHKIDELITIGYDAMNSKFSS